VARSTKISISFSNFLQIDPNPNSGQIQVVRRRQGNSQSRPEKRIHHKRSASSVLFYRFGLGRTSADISVLNRESDSDSFDLFDEDKARVVHFSRYNDEPPTSPSATTTSFSKNSHPSSPPPPSHLAFYSPTTSGGHKAPGESTAEAAFDAFLKRFPRQ
jgi:hypothetical protein